MALNEPARSRVAPSLPAHALFGHIPQMRRNALDLFKRSGGLGDIVRLHIVEPMHLVTHPDLVKQVLQDRHFNFRKSFAYKRLSPLIGKGLLTSDGEHWKRQRALIQPAFHRKAVEGLAPKMAARVEQVVTRWQTVRAAAVVDMHQEMTRLTLAILGDTLFSVDLLEEAPKTGRAVRVALAMVNRRLQAPVPLPLFVPTVQNVRLLLARANLDRMVRKILTARAGSTHPHDDVIGMMMAAQDGGTGARMDDRQVRDEVMTLALAGHETTAAALTWATFLLSQSPEHQERLHQEAARVLDGRRPTAADLPALEFTRRVLEETLRMYPPAWLFSREARVDENLGGYDIRAGSSLFLSPWVTQRDPRFWDDPERFDPDRFLPERSAGRPKFAFFPFAGGPRLCIGAGFAMMEMQIVLAMLVQRFRFVPVAGHVVSPEATVTLAPRGGLPMKLEPRR